MNQTGNYTHTNKERYRCEVLEEGETMVRVRLSEETARELRLAEELWLPKVYVKIDTR